MNAARRYDVAERELVLAEEFGEIVEKHHEKTKRPAVKVPRGWLKIGCPQEGR